MTCKAIETQLKGRTHPREREIIAIECEKSDISEKYIRKVMEIPDNRKKSTRNQQEIMSDLKRFELGKTYTHSSGKRIKIVGMAETIYHGNALIGEDDEGNLSPVQIDCDEFPEATIGWIETV